MGEYQKKVISQLQVEKVVHLSIISDLNDGVVLLNLKLDNLTKFVRMLNGSSDCWMRFFKLERMLEILKVLLMIIKLC